MKLRLYMELSGQEYEVGSIVGEGLSDAFFSYDEKYMQMVQAVPISTALPFGEEPFTPRQTQTFFEGLLPEGFTRRTVAHFIHADENDYLTILTALGKECLGALRVADEADDRKESEGYEEITVEEMKALAREGASKSADLVTKAHLSLTGASGKVGLYYDEKWDKWYLPQGTAPSTHIVKQSHVRLNAIIVNEQLSLLTARKLGIETPESFIVSIGGKSDDEVLFASKRYDRKVDARSRILCGLPCPYRCHQEDFAQALGIASADKYEPVGEHYMNRAFELIRRVSANPLEDQGKLWNMLVFDFLIGNTDAHLKNFSFVYQENGKGIRLAPAYDMVSTAIYEQSSKDMAFRVGGISDIAHVNRDVFAKAVSEAGLGSKAAMNEFDRMADGFERALSDAAAILKEQGFHEAETIRTKILKCGGYRNLQ